MDVEKHAFMDLEAEEDLRLYVRIDEKGGLSLFAVG